MAAELQRAWRDAATGATQRYDPENHAASRDGPVQYVMNTAAVDMLAIIKMIALLPCSSFFFNLSTEHDVPPKWVLDNAVDVPVVVQHQVPSFTPVVTQRQGCSVQTQHHFVDQSMGNPASPLERNILEVLIVQTQNRASRS